MKTRDLMRLHDGELPADEAERVRAALGDDDHARLSSLREVGDAVRECAQSEAADARLDLWAQLSDQLDAPPAGEVIPLRSRRGFYVASGLLVAAAAVLALFLSPGGGGSPALVESVEFGDHGGMVIQDHAANTTLIWQTNHEGELE
jgi:anti-sigma factor RsiW